MRKRCVYTQTSRKPFVAATLHDEDEFVAFDILFRTGKVISACSALCAAEVMLGWKFRVESI